MYYQPPPTCYLAGPISHKSYADATEWREDVSKELAKSGVHCISPLRGKGLFLAHAPVGEIERKASDFGITPRQIVTRDLDDIRCSDLVLANLLDVKKNNEIPIGTPMEIFAAAQMGKPVVTVANDIRSPWLDFHSIRVVPTMEEAIRVIRVYFNTGVIE